MKQGSAEWLNARCGKLTASRMADAMNFRKNGKEGAERTKLKVELLAERMTGDAVPHFVNDAMRHGLSTEPEAKLAYEAATGVMLGECGFFDHPEIENCGASPDSLIGRDGLAEFKCPATTTHVAWLLAGVVPEQHKPQMLLQMACTGRAWCDFVSYDPRIKGPQALFIRRFTPTKEEIQKVEEAAKTFLAELEQLFEAVTTVEVNP